MTDEDIKNLDISFDIRPSHIREVGTIYPPFPFMVTNAEDKVIPFCFFINLKSGRIGKYVHKEKDGTYYLTIEMNEKGKKDPVEEWITVPGCKIKRLVEKELYEKFKDL